MGKKLPIAEDNPYHALYIHILIDESAPGV